MAEEIIVVERPDVEIKKETVDYYTKKLHKTVQIVPNKIDVSSKDIMMKLLTEASIVGMVPPGLEKDILELYTPLLNKYFVVGEDQDNEHVIMRR